jgi:CHAD domain-containing protein
LVDGKWIVGLSRKMPIVEAARRVCDVRFEVVLHYLPLAARAAHRDIENVHHLRVATRRATAALRIFHVCLPAKAANSIRKSLRRLRRAAGAARDWDVFMQALQESPMFARKSAASARDFLSGFASARRLDAQRELAAAAASEGENFLQSARELSRATDGWAEPDQSIALGQLADSQIRDLIDELDRKATLAPVAYEDLHALRILGKRLRYSMEIFADCYAEPFREQLYPAIEEMQEILGRITDAHVANERISELRDHFRMFHRREWARYRTAIDALLHIYRTVLPRERKLFRSWLANWDKLTRDWKLETLKVA